MNFLCDLEKLTCSPFQVGFEFMDRELLWHGFAVSNFFLHCLCIFVGFDLSQSYLLGYKTMIDWVSFMSRSACLVAPVVQEVCLCSMKIW